MSYVIGCFLDWAIDKYFLNGPFGQTVNGYKSINNGVSGKKGVKLKFIDFWNISYFSTKMSGN